MPGKPREKSKTGMIRGIGQQDIFYEEDDINKG